MEMKKEGDYNYYTYRYIQCHHQNDSTPASRWAAMTVILCFIICEGQSHKAVSTNYIQPFCREGRAETTRLLHQDGRR